MASYGGPPAKTRQKATQKATQTVKPPPPDPWPKINIGATNGTIGAMTPAQANTKLAAAKARAMLEPAAVERVATLTDQTGTAWPMKVLSANTADAVVMARCLETLIVARMVREKCSTFQDFWTVIKSRGGISLFGELDVQIAADAEWSARAQLVKPAPRKPAYRANPGNPAQFKR